MATMRGHARPFMTSRYAPVLYALIPFFCLSIIVYFRPTVPPPADETVVKTSSVEVNESELSIAALSEIIKFDKSFLKQMVAAEYLNTTYIYRAWSLTFNTSPVTVSAFTTALGRLTDKKADIVTDRLIEGKIWEEGKVNAAMEVMAECAPADKGCTFLDIGGNVGWYSMVIAGAGYKTITFEPLPSNVRTILKSITHERNRPSADSVSAVSRIQLYPYGASSKYEQVEIWSKEKNLFNGYIKNDDTQVPDSTHVKQADILLVPVDDFVKEHIHLAKLDIEGYEPFVLNGMLRLIEERGVKFLLVEMNYGMLRQNGYDNQSLLRQINTLGYECVPHNQYSNLVPNGPFKTPDTFPNVEGDMVVLCKHRDFIT